MRLIALLLIASAVAHAHHGEMYASVFAALESRRLEDVKRHFAGEVWSDALARKVKTAVLVFNLTEGTAKTGGRRVFIAFTLADAALKKTERWWLLAETATDKHPRAWKIVAATTDGARAMRHLGHAGSPVQPRHATELLSACRRLVGLFAAASKVSPPAALAPYVTKVRAAGLQTHLRSVHPWGGSHRVTLAVRYSDPRAKEPHSSSAFVEVILSAELLVTKARVITDNLRFFGR